MKRLKFLLPLIMGFVLIACSVSNDEDNNNPNNNGNNGSTPETEEPTTENLPSGVTISDETVQLNSVQLKNIISADDANSTLTFSAALPEEQIPTKGEILLQFTPTEELPYGFLGRVTSVTQNNDKIIVATEAPTLIEAFDKLCLNDTFDLVPNEMRASIETDEDGYKILSQDVELNVGPATVKGEVGFGAKLIIDSDIDNEKGLKNVDISLGAKINALANATIKTTDEGDAQTNICPAIQIPSPGRIALKIDLQPKFIMKWSGEASLSAGVEFSSSKVFNIRQDGQWGSAANNESAPDCTSKTSADAAMEFALKGEVLQGVALCSEIRLFGRDELQINVNPYTGCKLSAEIDSEFSRNGYESFKDISVTSALEVGADASAKADLFFVEAKWEDTLFSKTFLEQPYYIFPEFSEGKYEVDDDNIAQTSVKAARDTFMELTIGVGQYDGDGNLVKVGGELPYHFEEVFTNPLSAQFQHTDDYTYWSVIKWGNSYLKCTEIGGENVWVKVSYHPSCDEDTDFIPGEVLILSNNQTGYLYTTLEAYHNNDISQKKYITYYYCDIENNEFGFTCEEEDYDFSLIKYSPKELIIGDKIDEYWFFSKLQ